MTKKVFFGIFGRANAKAPFHYTLPGLDYVWLLSGFTIEDHPDYGEIVGFEDEESLHHAIGLHIIEKKGDMTGAELRFLRREMDMTQERLAELTGVNVQTIANYEKGVTPISGPVRALLGVIFVLYCLPKDASASGVRALAFERRAMPARERRRIARRWQTPKAA